MTELDFGFRRARGGSLAGVLRVPDAALPAPGIVLCQGLSGVKHLVLPEVAERLAAAGLASLRFDYAGYGESGGERGWIDPRARVGDAAAALRALASHESVDPRRIGAYGHSYGGPVAIALAAREQSIRAVVSVSGPGNGANLLRSLRASWDWIAFKRRVEEARERYAATGEPTPVEVDEIFPFSPAFKASYKRLKAAGGGTSAIAAGDGLGSSRFYLASVPAIVAFRPEDEVRALRDCPLLMIHGADDDVAPIEDTEAVYANAPEPKELLVVPGAGHNQLDADPGLGEAVEQAAAWFTRHLRSG